MSGGERVVRRAGDVRYRVLAGEAVVLQQRRGEVLGVDEVGARILELADGERRLEAIVEQLEREFEVERGPLEADVVRFVDELCVLGVLLDVTGGERS